MTSRDDELMPLQVGYVRTCMLKAVGRKDGGCLM